MGIAFTVFAFEDCIKNGGEAMKLGFSVYNLISMVGVGGKFEAYLPICQGDNTGTYKGRKYF
eukprot:14678921-Ditylum_brightwellii.AAC.1